MSAFGLRRLTSALLVCAATLSSSDSSLACAVCFGDPNAAITQGAKAGMLILLGVIGTVLTGILGVTLFWIRRARRLQTQEALDLEMSPLQGHL